MQEDIQYPIQNDHDAVVTLMTEFRLVAKSINDKIIEDHKTTLEVKQIVQDQYTQLSNRIALLEDNLSKLNPEEIAQLRRDVDGVKLWIRDFNTKKHVAWVIASTGFIFIGYYIPFFLNAISSLIWNIVHIK